MCNGRFLLELIDDTALFAGLWTLLGFFMHAWWAVSAMPSRGQSAAAKHAADKRVDDGAGARGSEGGRGIRGGIGGGIGGGGTAVAARSAAAQRGAQPLGVRR